MKWFHYWIDGIGSSHVLRISEGRHDGCLGANVNEKGIREIPKIINNTWYGGYHVEENKDKLFRFLNYNGVGDLLWDKISEKNRELLET